MTDGLMINIMPTGDDLIGFPWGARIEAEQERTITGYPIVASASGSVGPTLYNAAIWRSAISDWPALEAPASVRSDPTMFGGGLGCSPYLANICSGLFLFAGVAASTTGDPLTALRSTYRAYTHDDDQQESAETSYRISIHFVGSPRRTVSFERSSSMEQSDAPAALIRQRSGLDVDDLATIFGVSRPAYHKWLNGIRPRATHEGHVLEALPLIEEVAARLGSVSAAREWLRTPISPNGKKPIDLLREREYDSFRGALLRVPTGREVVRLLPPHKPRARSLSRELLEEGLERMRPRIKGSDPDADDPGP